MTWSPADTSPSTAVVSAAIPDAVTMAASVCSSLGDYRRDLGVVRVAVAGVEVVAPRLDGDLRELLRVLGQNAAVW